MNRNKSVLKQLNPTTMWYILAAIIAAFLFGLWPTLIGATIGYVAGRQNALSSVKDLFKSKTPTGEDNKKPAIV